MKTSPENCWTLKDGSSSILMLPIDRLSKRMLTSCTFMCCTATFLKHKMDKAKKEKKHITAFAMKEPVPIVLLYNNVEKSLPIVSDPRSDELSRRESSRSCLKHRPSHKEVKNVKRHCTSSKLAKNKYPSRLDLDSKDKDSSNHKGHRGHHRKRNSWSDSVFLTDFHNNSRPVLTSIFQVLAPWTTVSGKNWTLGRIARLSPYHEGLTQSFVECAKRWEVQMIWRVSIRWARLKQSVFF